MGRGEAVHPEALEVPVGCVPRTHCLIGVIACLPRPRSINSAGPGPVGRGITPYKFLKELNAFVLVCCV